MDVISMPIGLLSLIGRLALAAALGAVIGWNREVEHKPAGLRTHALASLGAALFTAIGLALGVSDASATGRVLQGIVVGIGFIGGGVILHRDDPKGVHGLTTAAAIWVASGVGVASAAGLWRAAIATVAITLIVLIFGEPVDRYLSNRAKNP